MLKQRITVLGATGSIGVSTLNVLAQHPERYSVFALTAHTQDEALFQQCLQFSPEIAVMSDPVAAERLRERCSAAKLKLEVLAGEAGLVEVAKADEVDVVMAAIVGAAGLVPALAAAEAGKRILLANKEALVMAGSLFMDAVSRGGATLLPIDSEHNAIFQALPHDYESLSKSGVSKLLLTASGGPFRTWDVQRLRDATPEQACAHPNWSMGRKISVDSASLMNKGLELIEACWLFDVAPEQVEVVVHPQSVIHSMVQYIDGSVLAQLGNPDMRTPIAHALAWPERIDSGVAALNLFDIARLDFEEPDVQRFPCLRLAQQAIKAGGVAPAVLNAANEEAVAAFLAGQVGFMSIAEINEAVLNDLTNYEPKELADVQQADLQARALAQQQIKQYK